MHPSTSMSTETHPHRPLPTFVSHRPQYMKEGVVSCCIQRVQTVTWDVNRVSEEDHLKGVLEGNRYPRRVCNDS